MGVPVGAMPRDGTVDAGGKVGRKADAIAEGVAIAVAAARLAVKNTILVSTIAHDETFDPDHFVDIAKSALLDLAHESDDGAARLQKLRQRASRRHSDPDGTHDYRARDVRNLRRRIAQGEAVAAQLRVMAEEPTQLRRIVEDARDAAWADVRRTLDSRLRVEGMRPDDDPDYAAMREARMQALQLVDLQALAAQARKRRPPTGTDD